MNLLASEKVLLTTLLHRLSQEITGFRRIVAKIEVALHISLIGVSVNLTQVGEQETSTSNLQNIDLLDQLLADISVLVFEIASEIEGSGDLLLDGSTIFNALKLDDLKNRMIGKTLSAPQSASVEFF